MADEWLHLLTVPGSKSATELINKFCCCFYEYFLISKPSKDQLGGKQKCGANSSNAVTIDTKLQFFCVPGHNICLLIMHFSFYYSALYTHMHKAPLCDHLWSPIQLSVAFLYCKFTIIDPTPISAKIWQTFAPVAFMNASHSNQLTQWGVKQLKVKSHSRYSHQLLGGAFRHPHLCLFYGTHFHFEATQKKMNEDPSWVVCHPIFFKKQQEQKPESISLRDFFSDPMQNWVFVARHRLWDPAGL